MHIESPDGELKVCLEPRIEVAQNHGIPERQVTPRYPTFEHWE